jgi:hypothetical protein
MSRRNRIPYHLDAKGVKSLPVADIRAILRGADELIAAGGRSLLTKVLKGSRAKDVLNHKLDQNPSHGFYRDLAPDEILRRIDWAILHGYLEVIYVGQLPVLVYTPTGWNIERETYANEILHGFDSLLANAKRPYDMSYLKDMNRDLILLVHDKVQASGDRKYVPVLEDWEQVDVKKVRQRIREVIQGLTGGAAD